MKYIKISLCFLLFLSSSLFANIVPRFGIKSVFNYTDLKESDYVPNSIFSNDTYFYIGFEYINANFYVGFKPAFRIYTKDNTSIVYSDGSLNKKRENNAYITFTFDEAEFTYVNNILGFYFGKREFHFGEGFNRQYMFVGDSVLYNDYKSIYNTELNIYQNNITHSIGFMTDTSSIDNLKAPKYYLGWYYIKYSTPSLGLMGIAEYRYDMEEKHGNNLKLGFETSYIFDIGIKLYGNVIYNIVSNDNIGESTDNIKSLIGGTYTWMYGSAVLISPYIEYFYEKSHSFYSIGLYTAFFDGLLNITSSFSYSPGYKMNLIARLGLNIKDFVLAFTYNTPLETDETLENIFELTLEYRY